MSETKFTPGPWEARSDPCHFYTISDVYAGERLVAQSCSNFPEIEANAHLIAAGPDLYSALRGMFCPRPCNHRPEEFDVGDCFDAGECGCLAGTALSKARGEQSS